MELETEDFKEEEMFIIGEFGRLVLILKLIKQQLVLLIVNLELNHCRYGRQLFNLLNRKIESTKLDNFNLMKGMEVVLIHLEDI
jgi:hypothetical protein